MIRCRCAIRFASRPWQETCVSMRAHTRLVGADKALEAVVVVGQVVAEVLNQEEGGSQRQ